MGMDPRDERIAKAAQWWESATFVAKCEILALANSFAQGERWVELEAWEQEVIAQHVEDKEMENVV